MRAVKRNGNGTSGFSFDSFLDIVTNLVGLMILLAVLVALGATDLQVSLGTPLLHDPPEQAKRIIYECRGNRVTRVKEPGEIADEFIDRQARHRNVNRASLIDEFPRLFDEHDVGDSFYRVKVTKIQQWFKTRGAGIYPVKAPVWLYEPRRPLQGQSIDELISGSSAYKQFVASLDPHKHYVYFLVRQDSFEAFRLARQMAHANGLAVGWSPMPLDRPLQFGPLGEETDVQ